jgi:hypothetical protein
MMNDPNILANLAMALAAVASLIVTVILYYRSLREHRTLEATRVNLESLSVARQMLLHVPEALRFEGISEQDLTVLKEAGITSEEAVYLLIHFKAGAQFFQVAKTKKITPYRPGDYRYTTLSVPETRIGWNILRKALSNSQFKQRMDATVACIEQEQQQTQVREQSADDG